MWFYRILLWVIGSLIAAAGAEALAKEVAGRKSATCMYKVAAVLAVIFFFVSMVVIPIIDPHVGIWYKFTVALGIGAAVGLLYAALMFIVNRRRFPKNGFVKYRHRRW